MGSFLQRPALLTLLTGLLPLLTGFRPFESFDGPTTPPGTVGIEWGALAWQIHEGDDRSALTMPQVLLRTGLSQRLELGLTGQYQFRGAVAAAPWQAQALASQLGLYGKLLLIGDQRARVPHPSHGAYQTLERPAISLLVGGYFLEELSLWGVQARAAGSMAIGPVQIHLNAGFHYDSYARVSLGALCLWPLRFGLAPLLEFSGEVRLSHAASASVLLGVQQALPWMPVKVDLAVRRALAAGAADWSVLLGATMELRFRR